MTEETILKYRGTDITNRKHKSHENEIIPEVILTNQNSGNDEYCLFWYAGICRNRIGSAY